MFTISINNIYLYKEIPVVMISLIGPSHHIKLITSSVRSFIVPGIFKEKGRFSNKMARTLIAVLFVAITLFGVSHASPYGLYGGGGAMGNQLAMQEALLNFRTMCTEVSGSDAGYQKTIRSLRPAIQCLAENVDLVKLSTDLASRPETPEERKKILDSYCPAFNESVACFDDVLEGVAMCGNDDVGIIKAMYTKMIHNMIELMCKNNGQLLLEARTPEFRTCINHIKQNVDQCKVSGLIKERPITQFGAEGCRELQRSKTCVEEQASECTTSAYMDIFEAIFQPITETASCNKVEVLSAVDENAI